MHYLMFSELLCTWAFSDPSHRAWNDLKEAAALANLWSLILIHVIILNLDFGPFEGGRFFQRAQEAWTQFTTVWIENDPLFVMFFSALLRDFGWEARASDPGIEKAVFDHMCAWCSRKSERTSLSRWMHYLIAASIFDEWWHTRLIVYVFLGLAEGWASSQYEGVVAKRLRREAATSAVADAGGPAEGIGTRGSARLVAQAARRSVKKHAAPGPMFLGRT